MSLMRTYRAALALSQSAFAVRLNVPLETYRTWDSGRREPSKEFLSSARTLAAHQDDTAYCPRTRSTPSDGLILRWTLAGSRRS